MNYNRIFITIAQAEGFRARPYYCTAGKLTIGYGWNLEDNDFPQDIADTLLSRKIEQCQNRARDLVENYDALSELRQEVLVEMIYQLGARGVSRFTKTLRYIENSNFVLASIEMLDSRWARQTPGRARRLAENMRNG